MSDIHYKKLPCRRCGRVWKWALDKKSIPYCPEGVGCTIETYNGGLGMKFIKEYRYANQVRSKIEMEVHDESTLDEVLEEFQTFLRACGYVIEYNQCLVLENME